MPHKNARKKKKWVRMIREEGDWVVDKDRGGMGVRELQRQSFYSMFNMLTN